MKHPLPQRLTVTGEPGQPTRPVVKNVGTENRQERESVTTHLLHCPERSVRERARRLEIVSLRSVLVSSQQIFPCVLQSAVVFTIFEESNV